MLETAPGILCGGHGKLREFSAGPWNGNRYFMGCSKVNADTGEEEKKKHMFFRVPAHIVEAKLKEIDCKIMPGSNSMREALIHSGPCYIVKSARTGHKLLRCCEYYYTPEGTILSLALALIHFRDGKLVVGKMIHRPCEASLSIFVPVNNDIRSAIVIPTPNKFQNHPRFPPEKLTHDAKRQYANIIKAHGKPGASLAAIDHCKTLA